MANINRNGANKPKQAPKRATKAKSTSNTTTKGRDKSPQGAAEAPRGNATSDDASKSSTDPHDSLSVSDIARELKVSPKTLRGRARKAGLHKAGTKWAKVERDGNDHKALVALIAKE